MNRRQRRLARIEALLTRRNAWLTLVALALVTVPALFALRHVRLDHDFEKFFPQDDPELDRYLAFRERFGHDNEFVLFGLEHQPSVFDRDWLKQVDRSAGDLTALTDVRQVNSLTRLNETRVTPGGVFTFPWLRLEEDSTLAADQLRIMADPLARNFINPSGDALLLVMNTEQNLSKARSDSLLARIERTIAASGLENVRIAGRIHGQHYYIERMTHELVTFFLASLAMLVLFLIIAFRTGWGVGAPIAVVGLTVLWQVALMTALGKPLSILTMLLPTILFVVGMSDAVHIIERYIEALREGLRKERALAVTFDETGLSTFITMLSTAIGYATLAMSGIQPMREFGIYTAFGVFLAYALAFTLLPAVLLLVPTPVPAERQVRASLWDRTVHDLLRLVLRRRRTVMLTAIAITALCAVFIPRIKVNNFLLEDLPDSDPQKQGFLWFEKSFGGVRPFDLEVTMADTARTIWDPEVLHQIAAVQDHVEQVYGIHHIASPVSLLRAANKAMNGGDSAFHQLPEDPAETKRLARNVRAFAGTEALAGLVSADGRVARISGRMIDEGGAVHRVKNTELEGFIAQHTNPSVVRFNQTGMAFLIDRNNETLSRQMILSLALSFLLIAAIMTALFRDLRLVIIALIPNVVPMVFIAGLMGLVGIDLKVSTAIIFSNAFGIAVDDTIHLLGKLRIELSKGKSLPYAMKRTYLSGGKAVIVMSLMLCAGFITLIASDFASVYYMGLLISITLGVALLSELFLLPLLVLYFLGKRKVRVIG